MSKIIVTGGAGFIGSHLVSRLDAMGHEIIIIDNFSTGNIKNLSEKYQEKTNSINIYYYEYDGLLELCKDAEYMFHMAAQPSVQKSIDYPLETSIIDLHCTVKMLNIAKEINAKKFIFSSSSSVYGNTTVPTKEENKIKPKSPYALSKYQGEQYCKMYSELYNLNTVCLRYFNVYGPRMTNTGAYRSVLSVFLEAYKQKSKLNIVNDGNQKRDFVHVNDVVNANIMAMNSNIKMGCSINIGFGNNYSVNNIADIFGGEKIYGEKRIEPKITLADISRARSILGWQPEVNLCDWIKEQL